MAETLSLMDFLQQLHTNPQLRADFAADPTGSLSSHGLGDLSPLDIHDALVLIEDTRTADFDGGHGTGAQYAPPPAFEGDAAVEYLNRYVTGADGGHPSFAEDFADPDLDLPLVRDGAGDDERAVSGDGGPAGFGEGGSHTGVFAFDGGDDLTSVPLDAGHEAYDDYPDLPAAGTTYPDDLPYDGFGAGFGDGADSGPADPGPHPTDLPDS